MNKTLSTLIITAFATVLISGCDIIPKKEDSPDYRSAQTLPPLEVPPGLKRKGGKGTLSVPSNAGDESTTLSTYESQNSGAIPGAGIDNAVLPEFDNIQMLRSGDERWLVVKGTPEDLWPRITDFWLKDRIRLVVENPGSGVMETDWLENYAEINTVAQRWFRKILGSVVTADSYDKFRVRVEAAAANGSTEIFLTHRGVSADELPKENSQDVIQTRWVAANSDHNLEAEMLRLLMMHLGLDEDAARGVVASAAPARPDRAVIEPGDGGSRILVSENVNDTWRRVGLALDRIGFTVEDQNRTTGTFFVRSVDPKAAANAASSNWVGRLFRRDNKQVEFKSRVQVADLDGRSVVTVRNDSGDIDNTGPGQRILGLLLEELK